MKKLDRRFIKGIVMAMSGAGLWGISGVVVQRLFDPYQFDPGWLVNIRLLIAGAMLLMMSIIFQKDDSVFSIFREKKDRIQIIIFAVFGMFSVQYTFFVAIEKGNAATATLLQYLGPALIVLYVAWKLRRFPTRGEWLALSLALLGTFFLITNGSLNGLKISTSALIWGLLSAVTAAFYTYYPQGLIKRWGSLRTIGWGMFLAGIIMTPFQQPWNLGRQVFNTESIILIMFVVVFGTLCSFFLYLDSLRYLTPTQTGLLGMAEPFSSVIVSVIWLGHTMGFYEYLGGICIVGTVVVLSLLSKIDKKSENIKGKAISL